jgi:hypothetical protein
MASNSRRLRPAEFAIWENDHRYTRETGTIENDTTTAGTAASIAVTTELLGQPLRLVSSQWQFASSAEVTAGNVLTAFLYAVLARGPALVNEGRIPVNDVYGVAIVEADYISACESLLIYTKVQPTVTSTQTT